MIRAGRGFGKGFTGSNVTHEKAKERPRWMALVAATPADARDFMVEIAPSAILNQAPPHERPQYEPSKRRLTWANGSFATVFSGEKPDQLRGFSGDFAWIDELGKFANASEVLENLQFGMREAEGDSVPQIVITTTPKPKRVFKELEALPHTITTVGSSYENRANLSPYYFERVIARYEGTTLGQQEIYAALLDEAEGALWDRPLIEQHRVTEPPQIEVGEGEDAHLEPHLRRVVIAIDPAGGSGPENDETGIVATGLGYDDQGFLLADRSGRYTPNGWARKAIYLYDKLKADLIVAEVNHGGDMVEATIRTVNPSVRFKAVHASRGKAARAEPIVGLYEQGRIHHVGGFSDLEDQLCTWEEGESDFSPDRLDALVWGFTELMIDAGEFAIYT